MTAHSRLDPLRRRAGSLLVDGFFRGVSRLGAMHPLARPERHGVTVTRDVPYADGLNLDVWRPAQTDGPTPAVLYVHGGGFRILSKDTHWVMALAFAREGYTVFNVDYRLAPKHPFPAALDDVSRAWAWVCEHAPRYGADPQRLVLAGESAGANLATALTLAATFERDEPYAKRVFDTAVLPRAVLPACGILQVTDPERFVRRRPDLPRFIADRIEEVSRAYVGNASPNASPALDLADPLRVLEGDALPARPLPPFFLTCGTADPILDDTRRLHAALTARGARSEVRYYRGEPHAFQAFVFRESARQHWRDTHEFLRRHVPR